MSDPEITVTKYGATVPISCCVLTEATGENHCVHPPAPRARLPWHRWLRWSISAWWYDHGPRVHFGPCDHGGWD